jgi:predicted ATPase/class 3 adenylate cyclase
VRSDLPSGTVTFLFTDVEGSTQLLHELGAARYAEALAAHGRVIREACMGEGGVEVNTWGDSFFFAFPTAPGALAAAARLTEALAEGPVRVRVGVHTGTPLLEEGDYVGHDVHRAARIAAAGHGGQVLVSASTATLVETELTDLGEHRFKDLGAPERVFQLGDREFPALTSLYRTNLPVPATAFLGRQRELHEVVELIRRENTRLVTLTGPGGTGKTRLSIQAAAEASDAFPDGVFWVALAPLRDASLLETTVAQALEVHEQPGVTVADSIVGSFSGKRALTVVDNCEHLVDAVAVLVRKLVDGCPRVVIVASSRERLGLRSESVYVVPPMLSSDSERLFCERAWAVAPEFEPDEHVAPICAAVDGIPLAIELAAARLRSLSTQAIRERLGERLGLLTSRDRDVDERQRTIEGAIAWSYNLLDPDEQRVVRGLSVFAGGCTLEAAEEVAGADLDLVESLLDKSLLRRRIDEAGQDRYWMLETIREFMAARLSETGTHDALTDGHRAFFVALARQLAPAPGRPRTAEQFGRFRADQANFRLALLRAIENGDATCAIRIVRFLGRLWYDLRELRDSFPIAKAALGLRGGETEDRAHALVEVALFAGELGEIDEARAMLTEAEALFASLEDAGGLADAGIRRAYLESTLGNPREAISIAERALELALQVGDDDRAMRARGQLAHGLMVAGFATDPPDREAFERALEIHIAGLDELRGVASPQQIANELNNLGVTLYLLERNAEALWRIQQAIRLAIETGPPDSRFLFNAGFVAGGLGQSRTGVRLSALGRRELENQGFMVQAIDRRLLDELEARARAALGDEGYETAVRAGEAMTLDEGVELALSVEADV